MNPEKIIAILQSPTVVTPAVALLFASALPSQAAVSYTSSGASYTQNFNTLETTGTTNTWTNNITIPGWYAAQGLSAGSIVDRITYEAATGASQQGRLLSIGTSTDRALGGQNDSVSTSTITTMYYALSLANDTGTTLSSFSLEYTGEQWRAVQNENRDRMNFQYQIFSAGTGSIAAATGWMNVSSLGFDAPVITTGNSGSLDGNAVANRILVSGSTTGISWSNGQELWLRWADSSSGNSAGEGGTRAMLGLDDLSFSAIPEPSSFLLTGLGMVLLALRRRVS